MNVNNVDEAYAVLGLRTGARIQEIADAWTELTKLWDPNLHAVGSKAYEQCMRMREMTNAAYQMLMSRSGVQQAPGSKEPPSAPKSAPIPIAIRGSAVRAPTMSIRYTALVMTYVASPTPICHP